MKSQHSCFLAAFCIPACVNGVNDRVESDGQASLHTSAFLFAFVDANWYEFGRYTFKATKLFIDFQFLSNRSRKDPKLIM
jgi:hypothetical protein